MSHERILSVIDEEISKLQQVKRLLQSAGGSGVVSSLAGRGSRTRKKRVLSSEARQRIAAAQKRRWAKQKKEAAAK